MEVEPNHGVYVEQNYEEMFKQYVDIKKLKEKEQESCWSCLIDELIKQGFIIIRKNCVIVVLNKINNKQAKTLDSFLSEVGVLKVKEYTEEENTEYEYRPSGNTM
ncbi:MAG: hypothetical protein LBU27_02925 [Candidatus Peribacteria bacterium]|nr:hypothetical protein [Candidatus Peribacteria bacterium]